MKRYIKSSSGGAGVYSGEALATYEKLTNGMTSYTPNQFYINEKYGQIFYINNSGYLHTLQKENGCVEDYVLTKDNKLRFDNTYCKPKYDKEAWEQFKEMIKTAERV